MVTARAEITAVEAEFAARIDRIRARVTIKLAGGIEQADTALSQMIGDGSEAIAAVASVYRWLHDISGIGPIIGFATIGQHARSCAGILVRPFREQRGLSPQELELLTSGLESLRIAALKETHSAASNQRVTS
jgi:hypothetical protein